MLPPIVKISDDASPSGNGNGLRSSGLRASALQQLRSSARSSRSLSSPAGVRPPSDLHEELTPQYQYALAALASSCTIRGCDNNECTDASDFHVAAVLGHGSYASVYRVDHKGMSYALKVLRRGATDEEETAFRDEATIHTYIVEHECLLTSCVGLSARS